MPSEALKIQCIINLYGWVLANVESFQINTVHPESTRHLSEKCHQIFIADTHQSVLPTPAPTPTPTPPSWISPQYILSEWLIHTDDESWLYFRTHNNLNDDGKNNNNKRKAKQISKWQNNHTFLVEEQKWIKDPVFMFAWIFQWLNWRSMKTSTQKHGREYGHGHTHTYVLEIYSMNSFRACVWHAAI